MKKIATTLCLVGALGALTAPALAYGPDSGQERRAQHQPTGTPQYDGNQNPGTEYQGARPESTPAPPSSRALGVACAGEPKERPEGDTERGTPFSRCVTALARALRSSKASSDRRAARSACKKPDFESGREYSNCVRAVFKALRST